MNKENRYKGFYWINRDIQFWEVAEWDGKYWQITGVSHNDWDGYVKEVGSRVPPPCVCQSIQEIADFYSDKNNA